MPVPLVVVLPDLAGGGAQRVMLSLARKVEPSKFSTRVICICRDTTLAAEIPSAIPLDLLGATRLRTGVLPLLCRLRRLRPRIVFSALGYLNLTLLALLPLLHRDTSIVVREANTVAATLKTLPRWASPARLYARLYARAAAIVAPTARIAAELAALVPQAGPRIHVIPNPVDVAALRARAMPMRHEPSGGLALVAAGRLTTQKGFDRLIDLMPLLPPSSTLTICGSGPERDDLDRRIAARGLTGRVRLTGFTSALPAIVAGADVFVLPSRWEGLPNVVLEALALGTPVVGSEEAGIEEIAAAAPAGAVSIARLGPEFVEAVSRHIPASATLREPRSSLLPSRYETDVVVQQFNRLLAGVATQSGDKKCR